MTVGEEDIHIFLCSPPFGILFVALNRRATRSCALHENNNNEGVSKGHPLFYAQWC